MSVNSSKQSIYLIVLGCKLYCFHCNVVFILHILLLFYCFDHFKDAFLSFLPALFSSILLLYLIVFFFLLNTRTKLLLSLIPTFTEPFNKLPSCRFDSRIYAPRPMRHAPDRRLLGYFSPPRGVPKPLEVTVPDEFLRRRLIRLHVSLRLG